VTFKEGITRNTRNCRNYHKDFTITEEDSHQSVASVGSYTTSKYKIIKKKIIIKRKRKRKKRKTSLLI